MLMDLSNLSAVLTALLLSIKVSKFSILFFNWYDIVGEAVYKIGPQLLTIHQIEIVWHFPKDGLQLIRWNSQDFHHRFMDETYILLHSRDQRTIQRISCRRKVCTKKAEKGETITDFQEKHLLTHKEVLLWHMNAPAHFSSITLAKLMMIRFQLVRDAPKSPDLTPTDHCTPIWKMAGGKKILLKRGCDCTNE